VTLNSSGGDAARMCNDKPDYGSWVSELFDRIFSQKRYSHVRIDPFTTITLYPAEAIWLVFKRVPQSAVKTVLEFELFTWATQESPFIECSVKGLKETTFAHIERLEALQKQVVEGSLSLDDGTYDIL
jgi:hypothetical protein